MRKSRSQIAFEECLKALPVPAADGRKMDVGFGSFGGNWTGAGSGLFEATALTPQQRGRSMVVQDTMRSVDLITWRRLLAYSRQLFTNYGEIRGPLMERTLLANSGIWIPRCISTRTPRKVCDQYEEFLWQWFVNCDVRGHPYDFWTDMLLAQISLDRDGEPPFLKTRDADGNPRLQWIANHRIYAPTGVWWVPDGPYKGMRFNNGVIYNEQSRPVAYRVLRPSIQFAQSSEYDDIASNFLYVTYNPDWCDSGRGTSAIGHALRRSFMIGELYESELKSILAASKTALIEYNDTGKRDLTANWIHGGNKDGETFENFQGDPIYFEDIDDGTIRYFRANSGNKLEMPASQRPHPNMPEFVEVLLRGIYQGLPWPYSFSRSTKELGGADLRVVVDEVNLIVSRLYARLFRIAHHACTYALATEIDRKNLPPGEFWLLEFSTPPKLTADRWRQYQEDRENYMLGHDTLLSIAAARGTHPDKIRQQRDLEMDDLFRRTEKLAAAHRQRMQSIGLEEHAMTFREVLEYYEQRTANPAVQKIAEAKETGEPEKPESNGNGSDEMEFIHLGVSRQ